MVHRPYLPAAFLLGPGLDVRKAWNGYGFEDSDQRRAPPRRPVDHQDDPARLGGPDTVSWCWFAALAQAAGA
jgi:hypothetical protein